MEIVGIICEYNPFHNGHLYHINKIKSMYPNSLIVLVMSGYFTERGDVSLLDKYTKTRLALENGVDLVLELPCLYTLNSADYFASSALKILSFAGVKKLVFGSESDDVKKLEDVVSKQSSVNFNDDVIKELDKGVNYPTALSKALNDSFLPNDILGISYIKAIKKLNLDIEPVTIKRTSSYKDISSDDDIISADNIRKRITNGEDISKYIPNYDTKLLHEVDQEKLYILLKYKIMTSNDLNDYLGVDEGLDNKLKKCIIESNSITELIFNLKSKRYTYARIKRMLIHILLGIKKEDMNLNMEDARILGFSTKGQDYLKTCDKDKLTFKQSGRARDIEMQSSYIYDEITHAKSMEDEVRNKPIIYEK